MDRDRTSAVNYGLGATERHLQWGTAGILGFSCDSHEIMSAARRGPKAAVEGSTASMVFLSATRPSLSPVAVVSTWRSSLGQQLTRGAARWCERLRQCGRQAVCEASDMGHSRAHRRIITAVVLSDSSKFEEACLARADRVSQRRHSICHQ